MGEILVTGLGIVSAYGCSLEEYFEGLTKMRRVQKTSNRLNAVRFQNPQAVEVDWECQVASPEERILTMGAQAIRSALLDWKGTLPGAGRTCLIVGSGLGLADQLSETSSLYSAPGYLSTLADKLARVSGINCEAVYIGNACCAGSQAVSYGMDLLHCGYVDVVIAGGLDILSPLAYAGFLRMNAIDPKACRPFDRERKGIAVGEGTAFFVLERESDFHKHPGKAYCRLAGSGVTNDAYHVVQMRQDGSDIKRAMQQALSAAGLKKEDVNAVIAHGTGTVQNDRIESQVVRDFFGQHLPHVYVTAPKSAIGHTGGASGAFGLLTAIGAILYGTVPPILNLQCVETDLGLNLVHGECVSCNPSVIMVNAFAFGGTNVVLICQSVSRAAGAPDLCALHGLGYDSYGSPLATAGPAYRGAMDRVGIIQIEYLDVRCFDEKSFEHRDARIMDKYTKMMVAVARNLRRRVMADMISPERRGGVVATNSGPVESIKELSELLAPKGFVALNPSKFPNIMLSTPLLHVAVELSARGPCVPLYINGKMRQALRYGVIQIEMGRCDGMAILYADEGKECFGLFMEREESARGRECDIRFYIPDEI